jgi:hypothetical protein
MNQHVVLTHTLSIFVYIYLPLSLCLSLISARALAQVLAESKHINLSLHYLEMCITALHDRAVHPERHAHVPYRNCMMTSVLKDSLGGNCKVRTRLVFVLLSCLCVVVSVCLYFCDGVFFL